MAYRETGISTVGARARAGRWLLVGLALAWGLACTYDFSDPSGTSTTTSASASTASGSAASGSAASASAASASAASSSTSGAGGQSSMTSSSASGQVGFVDCPTVGSCPILGGGCCFSHALQTGTCTNTQMCPPGETELQCQGPKDCKSSVCCATRAAAQGLYDDVHCQIACPPSITQAMVCDPNDTNSCTVNTQCKMSDLLPMGYFVCQ